MKSYEQLRTEYDEALFALLMEDAMQTEGHALWMENERLKTHSDASISPEADARIYAAIAAAYRNKRRQAKAVKIRRFFSRSLAAIFIAAVLVSIGCAVNPQVKARTQILMTKVTEKATILFASDGTDIDELDGESEDSQCELEHLDYELTYIPAGFYQYSEYDTEHFNCQEFKNEDNDNAQITVMISHSHGNMLSSMDTENADVIENININGNNGLLVIKGSRIHIETYDVNAMDFIEVIGMDTDKETVIKIAEGIQPIK